MNSIENGSNQTEEVVNSIDSQENKKVPEVQTEKQNEEYVGYSQEGEQKDKELEQKLELRLQQYSNNLDDIEKNYFSSNDQNIINKGVEMMNQLRDELDRNMPDELKTAKNFGSKYADIFFKKFIEIKMKHTS